MNFEKFMLYLKIACVTVYLVGFLVLACIFYKRIKKNGIPPVKIVAPKNVEGIVFGKFGWLYVCSPTDDEGHVGIFGGSGLGKTTGILIPTLKAWKGTSFVIDISGDIAASTREIKKLVFSPYEPSSLPYNVFYAADMAETKIDKDEELEKIAEAIMPDRKFKSDAARFYYNGGKRLLRASLLTYYYRGMDFFEVCWRVASLSAEALIVEIKRYNDPQAVLEVNALAHIKDTNLGSCKDELDAYVKPYINPRLRGLLRRPEMKGELYIAPPALEKCNVFINIPESGLAKMGPVLKLMVGQCFQYMQQRENYSRPQILFCLDEFASLGFLDIQGPLEKIRKKGGRIMVLIQGRVRLDSVYDELQRRAMMENMKFQAYLGVNDFVNQVELAEICGKEVKEDGRVDYKVEPARFGRMGNKLLLINPGKELWIRKIQIKKKRSN